ncbi:MAG: hypothetical protein QW734_06525 [Candidatus Bathyarchaeia archaeon]
MNKPKWIGGKRECSRCDLKKVEKFVRERGIVISKEIVDKFGVSKRQALKALHKLMDEGKVGTLGSGVYCYKVVKSGGKD